MLTTRRRHRLAAAVAVALAFLTSASRPAAQTRPLPATVTSDVLSRLLATPSKPVRVLMQGDPAQLRTAALRVGLTPLRVLDQYVVVAADAAQIAALRADSAVRLIAGDLQVSPYMVVSDKTMS